MGERQKEGLHQNVLQSCELMKQPWVYILQNDTVTSLVLLELTL